MKSHLIARMLSPLAASVVSVLLAGGHGTAWACATCIASAYGDRTFNWAMIGLILMPFAVGGVLAGVLWTRQRRARHHGVQSVSIEESA
ncbi:MAG: hypothetical protein HY294_04180 [Candidatus Rokubacteria bacterium]|nr:hypothetical protein [Candidatus Rokubacteria bacterium]